MKRTLLLGSVVVLALAGCQSSSNNTRPKGFGSNGQTPSSGVARTPTSTTSPSSTMPASTFPSSGSNVTPTGAFPPPTTPGGMPATTSNLGGANGRFSTNTALPAGVTPGDLNNSRLDLGPPPVKGPAGLNSGLSPVNGPGFGNTPGLNTMPSVSGPTLGNTPGMTTPNNLPPNPIANPTNAPAGTPNSTAPFQNPPLDPAFIR